MPPNAFEVIGTLDALVTFVVVRGSFECTLSLGNRFPRLPSVEETSVTHMLLLIIRAPVMLWPALPLVRNGLGEVLLLVRHQCLICHAGEITIPAFQWFNLDRPQSPHPPFRTYYFD